MEIELVAKEISIAFEYCYLHDDWVTPLEEALAGVSAADALWEPSEESKSIWAIVLHMAVWNENIVERVFTGEGVRPSEGAWPALPSATDEVAWGAAKQRLRNSLDEIRTMLNRTPLDRIQTGPYGIADLLVRFSHNAYHIGQITKIRERAVTR